MQNLKRSSGSSPLYHKREDNEGKERGRLELGLLHSKSHKTLLRGRGKGKTRAGLDSGVQHGKELFERTVGTHRMKGMLRRKKKGGEGTKYPVQNRKNPEEASKRGGGGKS